MKVKKRNGDLEEVNVNKIVAAVSRCAGGLPEVEPLLVATKTISGLYDGATTEELDKLSIQTAASLIAKDPAYSKLAARLLATFIDKEVGNQDIQSFSQSIEASYDLGLINERTFQFVKANARKLNSHINPAASNLFEFFGLRTVYDRYLLKNPVTRKVTETPQYFFMRVACGLAEDVSHAIELYKLFSTLSYLPATPTLFNSGRIHEQLSSCYLLDSPQDDLAAIYECYKDIALLSKFAGGIGASFSRVRSRGSRIKGTNGQSLGIIPFLKTLDSSIAAVNQCFAPTTTIFTSTGPKDIKDVVIGDYVIGHSGEFRRVEEKYSYPQQDQMLAIKIKHAPEPILVTDGHPFLAIQNLPSSKSNAENLNKLQKGDRTAQWVPSGELKAGDYIAQPIPSAVLPVDNFTDDDARMYGIILGDGHFYKKRQHYCIAFHPIRKAQTLKWVKEYLAKKNVLFYIKEKNKHCTLLHFSDGGDLTRNEKGQFMNAGKIRLPFSCEDFYTLKKEKQIAARFLHLPLSQTKALLKGLIETDGNISRGNEITFSNTSKPLIEGMRYQFLRLGVPVSGQKRTRRNGAARRIDGTPLSFKKEFTTSYNLRIPCTSDIASFVTCKPIQKQNWLIWNGYIWTRIRSIEKVPASSDVFDLKVEIDETYFTGAALVHNGGLRKGAACVFLETWHADIEDFLELRENTGDAASRTYNLNLANWIPDLFMQRVQKDGMWSLFDPKVMPQLTDLYGEAFEEAYLEAEASHRFTKQVKARDLYSRMMRCLAQTGNGWMNFKDTANKTSNQTLLPGNAIHSSNLCTEILEITSSTETAVCNLGSINLAQHVHRGDIDWSKLYLTVRTAVTQLDRVIDLNFYPIEETKQSNNRWRNIGLGVMGLQDVFFLLNLPFDSLAAQALSKRIAEEIYFAALERSCELAQEKGAHLAFPETRLAKGLFQFDLWGVEPTDKEKWATLRANILKHGVRNSLTIAIAPTATIASIAGCYECIEPQVSNLFKRETLSGDFVQINRYLVAEIKQLGLWDESFRNRLKLAEGSIQEMEELPADLRAIYRTAWEIPMRSLIDMAVSRGPFIDQSQSLNLFVESPNIGKLSSMYMYAWQQGLKTTYYLRSRPATRIAKTTVAAQVSPTEAIACSLESPEVCEVCQ